MTLDGKMLLSRKTKNPTFPKMNLHKLRRSLLIQTRLVIEKPTTRLEFDILNELKNICVKIPLLQAIKDIPIYSKVVKELCIKNPSRKQKDPPTIHLVGGLSEYISEQPKLAKYGKPGNPVVTITINEVSIGRHSHIPRETHQCYDRYYPGTITVTTSSSSYPNHFGISR
jgi:hypothetical protein